MQEIYQFPLKQHIGKKAAPIVVKGDLIQRGQLLAFQEEKTLGANIYSSVSGAVTEVTEKAIFIEADEMQKSEYVKLKSETAFDLIKEAGIVGLGGAGFPTYVKLSKPFEKDGSVIINAAECEPILSHNIARIEKNPDSILRGLRIAMDVTKAKYGIIAIKGYHTKAIERLKQTNQDPDIRIEVLPDMYPMGEERAIVREIFGTVLPVSSLPLEAGAIILNTETALRIHEAVDLKKPLIDKDITVGGKLEGNKQEKLIQVFEDVPIGTSVASVFRKAGGQSKECGELIMGGPFTGKRTSLEAPVVKTTGGLIAAECFPKGPEKIGLLVCACGADKTRLEEIAASLGSEVVGVGYCKQAIEVNGTRKCENPGKCPGQVQKVMGLKKQGAQAVLISNCTDCSNTVMSCAPKLGLPVYHCTDGALRAVNHKLVRAIHK